MQEKPRQQSSRKQSTWAAIFFAALFVFVLIAGFILGREVISDLERQRTASSDNVQWTLTQVEVEYLSYLKTLDHFAHDAQESRDQLPAELRERFDVFYSRVDTLASSPLFAELRATEDYNVSLAKVQSYLDQSVPIIDGATQNVPLAVDQLLNGAEGLQEDIRKLSLSGLSYFANLSDFRRADTADTLLKLAMIAVALLLMLMAFAGYLYVINRKMRQRGRALSQANARVTTVMATSLDAVIVADSDGRVLEFNPAAEAIFQYSRSEAMGQSIGDLIVPKHLRDAHAAGMERMKHDTDRHVIGKGRVQLDAMRANGEVFPVELALESAFNGTEEIIIGFVRDISERVAARTELITARDKALAGEKAKDNFLTVMSHEIRTPLNGLLGNLSLLTNSKLTKEQQRFTHNMKISGQVLMNHVDSVLDIARFEAGKMTAAHDKVSLSELMQGIVDGQSGNAASKGNAIQWQWVGTPQHWVLTDEQRLRQILLNLVGNAIKFTSNGRISLEVECTPSGNPDKPDFEFRVIDTGIGISDRDQSRIFDDFETSDPSISRNESGTGLGLGIARRFVSTLGGEIGVESELGQGSVFWVRIPFEITTAARTQSKTSIIEAVDKPLDVLVVEDNEINSEVMRQMLELDGHRVTLAQNGQAGVDAAMTHQFDVILMDISMPVMDGPTATKLIRSGAGQSKETPIIAVSANVLPTAIATFREAGMNAFLGKPITVESLRHALSTILHGGADKIQTKAADVPGALDDLKEQLGAEKLHKLLRMFVAEGHELAKQLGPRDWQHTAAEQVVADSHKLAGSAGVLGFDDLRSVLLNIENAARDGAQSNAEQAASDYHRLWASVESAIQAEVRGT